MKDIHLCCKILKKMCKFIKEMEQRWVAKKKFKDQTDKIKNCKGEEK